jgi:hypothetical protein
MIAQFYHLLVPLLRTVLEAKFAGRPPVRVFISPTGANKESYAAPLANYLGVDGVFLDKNLRVGAKGDDEMMWAAVSCKYFWCVLTKEFVQESYPMRELMMGYIRHIQEPGTDFVLIADCLETTTGPRQVTMSWMDQIFKLEALKLSNKNGTAHGFPANMQMNIRLESLDERFKRIAALPLADGSIIKSDARQADPALMAVLSNGMTDKQIAALPRAYGSIINRDNRQADPAPGNDEAIACALSADRQNDVPDTVVECMDYVTDDEDYLSWCCKLILIMIILISCWVSPSWHSTCLTSATHIHSFCLDDLLDFRMHRLDRSDTFRAMTLILGLVSSSWF